MISVAEYFIDHANKNERNLFLKLIDARESSYFTYGDIRDLAFSYNAHFRHACLPRGSVVAIILTHCVDLYGAFLGAMMAGLIPTIMPYPTPKQDKLRYWNSHAELFAISGIESLFTYQDIYEDVKTFLGERLKHVSTRQDVDLARKSPLLDSDDVALLQHSSGTTALKKGVMLTHKAIYEQITRYADSINLIPGSKIVTWLPLYHDMGLVSCFLTPMLIGCSISHLDPFLWSARPTLLLDEIIAFGGEFVWLPNFAFNHIVNNIRPGRSWDLSNIKAIINCSEPCKATTFDRFRAQTQLENLRSSALQVCYAMAENVFAVTQTEVNAIPRAISVTKASLRDGANIHVLQEGEQLDAENLISLLSCGRSIDGVEFCIMGADGSPMTEDRIVGEIAITGICLYSGYYRRPEITKLRLRHAWHYTGDLGFVFEGELYVTGRVDDLLIIRGKNVYAHEVEDLVSELGHSIPGRAVAFATQNETLGSDDLAIACETASGELAATARKEIREAVEAQFGVTVAQLKSVVTGTLIKTTSGKISRSENKKMFAENL